MPGDPITNLMGEDYIVSQESIDALKAELELDKPLLVQYALYWRDLIRLDLGNSYHFIQKSLRSSHPNCSGQQPLSVFPFFSGHFSEPSSAHSRDGEKTISKIKP